MRMLDVLTLKATTTAPDSTGKAAFSVTSTTVFAEPKGVKRSEFYMAQSAGMRIDAVFEVNEEEYTGHQEAEYSGVTYKITRVYPSQRGRTELICTRK
jgi:SPP1 family predicted phage head-tail adaptor